MELHLLELQRNNILVSAQLNELLPIESTYLNTNFCYIFEREIVSSGENRCTSIVWTPITWTVSPLISSDKSSFPLYYEELENLYWKSIWETINCLETFYGVWNHTWIFQSILKFWFQVINKSSSCGCKTDNQNFVWS